MMRQRLRPPAVPLVTVDPYLSVWSVSDELYGAQTRHWTRAICGMAGLVDIDGTVLRFLGRVDTDDERNTVQPAAMIQNSVEVRPTSTIYEFSGEGIMLRLTFTTPVLLDDIEVASRPTSYVTVAAWSQDGMLHRVRVYLDITGEWCVHSRQQLVAWGREAIRPNLTALRMGSERQQVLGRPGDDVRIDWGYVYLTAQGGKSTEYAIASTNLRRAFAEGLPVADDNSLTMPHLLDDDMMVLASVIDLGEVQTVREAFFVIGYDDIHSIQYFGEKLEGYWRTEGEGRTFQDVLCATIDEYQPVMARCAHFDSALLAECRNFGGDKYADMAALAYRQAFNAHKLVRNPEGEVLFLSKECNSNGCMGTVDVSYPSVPLFLIYNPELVKGMMRPIFHYANSLAWPYDFAPHDIGRYPVGEGQVYGMDIHRQMPVEECANMLIMAAAVAQAEGCADFPRDNWSLLHKWAMYLKDHGLDPGEQLCTDDFAGHLAHNANLSIKAIIGIGCYGWLCRELGEIGAAEEILTVAKEMAKEWERLADDGDHFRLTFDGPGSWSLKYNLIWDDLLGLHLFSPRVKATELAYYQTKQNRFGIPLDSRFTYTKADWLLWVAAMADSREEFEAIANPVWDYLNATRTRVPFSDWYLTVDGFSIAMYNRSVVGAVFMPLLRSRGWQR